MPITLPNLDDRTYDDLMQEARLLIPAYNPEWTNHNPSDPGITLLELFAYLAEMLIYRLNRVTDANVRAFLTLIDGVKRSSSDAVNLSDDVRQIVQELRRVNRAVTCKDFEDLVLAKFKGQIARVRCVARRNLTFEDAGMRGMDKPSSVSVIIVPVAGDSDAHPQPDNEMIQAVKEYLDERRLLTTRVHVVGPRYVEVGVQLTVFIKPDALVKDVQKQVEIELKRFFHPLHGGPDKKGWPFGRNVFVSEIYELLDRLPGVDYVIRTAGSTPSTSLDELITADGTRLMSNSQGVLMAVELFADELVSANISMSLIKIVSPLKSST